MIFTIVAVQVIHIVLHAPDICDSESTGAPLYQDEEVEADLPTPFLVSQYDFEIHVLLSVVRRRLIKPAVSDGGDVSQVSDLGVVDAVLGVLPGQ